MTNRDGHSFFVVDSIPGVGQIDADDKEDLSYL